MIDYTFERPIVNSQIMCYVFPRKINDKHVGSLDNFSFFTANSAEKEKCQLIRGFSPLSLCCVLVRNRKRDKGQKEKGNPVSRIASEQKF